MERFHLTEDAIFDINAIWLYFLEREGLETADRIVTEFFKAFYKLADFPGVGHRRTDLTDKPVLFYKMSSYLVIYATDSKTIRILGVLHSRRDVAHILKQRQS